MTERPAAPTALASHGPFGIEVDLCQVFGDTGSASSGQSAAELVFQAWSKNDRTAARYEAIPAAVDMLFARTYEAGWTFGACQVAAGAFYCIWQRTGDKLILEGNNSAATPFYYVNNVTREI